MAKSEVRSTAGSLFDLEKLRELVEMMEEHGLTEICLERGDEKWALRRGPVDAVQMVPAAAVFPPGVPVAAPAPPTETPAEKPVDDGSVEIKSPTVGTFYSALTPDDPPFVTVGSKVQADTTVCIVEAMKVFNQIPAELSGTISEILVANGDPVEFGQPLFKVRTG
ncbi:MAG: acetyl-CoA carboxylase biotin carboxyl carrier protein [Planctomycetes bacterium]|nr:acetyl-CoA carboxylase biotin carboxyl carrier protein [Planctomycetota bacterium]